MSGALIGAAENTGAGHGRAEPGGVVSPVGAELEHHGAARHLLQSLGAETVADIALLAEAAAALPDPGGLLAAARDWQPIPFPLRGADLPNARRCAWPGEAALCRLGGSLRCAGLGRAGPKMEQR